MMREIFGEKLALPTKDNNVIFSPDTLKNKILIKAKGYSTDKPEEDGNSVIKSSIASQLREIIFLDIVSLESWSSAVSDGLPSHIYNISESHISKYFGKRDIIDGTSKKLVR